MMSVVGGIALYGTSSGGGGIGVYGEALYDSGTGVYGRAEGSRSYAGYFRVTGDESDAIFAQNEKANGYAGLFLGNFAVVTGEKTAHAFPHLPGPPEALCQESSEVWFEDFGEGQLMGGLAQVNLDPLFLETVTINDQNPLKVFIQLNEDCNGVYVQRQAAGFKVMELRRGNSNASFTYRVVAKRKGFENERLAAAEDPAKHVEKMKLKEPMK